MKKVIQIGSCLAFYVAVSFVVSGSAAAASYLYNNGAANGSVGAWDIDDQTGNAVSNSFTLGSNSNLTAVDFAVWVDEGDSPTTVNWAITGNDFSGTVYASGANATLTTNDLGANEAGFELFAASFAAPVDLTAGTYWLQLDNGATTLGSVDMAWDETDGASAAYSAPINQNPPPAFGTITTNANYYCDSCTGSESFQIEGTTPEPGTIVMMFSGFLLLGGSVLRKARSKAVR